MLNIYFFNVGHGDSIAVQFPDNTWGIIDCNRNRGEIDPNVLKFLKLEGIKSLRFLCLTHPHDDHFKGIDKIIEYFEENIGKFLTYNHRVGSKNETNKNSSLAKFYQHRTYAVEIKSGKNVII